MKAASMSLAEVITTFATFISLWVRLFASTAVSNYGGLSSTQRCFKLMKTPEWQEKLKLIVPSF
jgi:hypothetical protein